MSLKQILNSKLCFTIIVYLHYVLTAENDDPRLEEASQIASATAVTFIALFDGCLETTMSNNMEFSDNMQKIIAQPVRTTVGFMTRFTNNRKFFANLITTPAFKEMLAKDEDEVRKNYIRKMRYCDDAIMDQELLKDFYDKEVDQSKL